MSELIKTKFRASYGLDAAGEKVVNVALADRNNMTDGTNVAYLIQENTIQSYDPERGYLKGFAIMQQDRVWVAKDNIPAKAGPFRAGLWKPLRTDPKWMPVNSGVRQLQPGDYITVDTSGGQNVELTLPSDAQDGDTIVVKDVGGRTGFVDVLIKAGLQSIMDRGQKLISTLMTVPYSEYVFVYVNRLWSLYNGKEADVVKYVNTASPYDIQSSDIVVRQYDKNAPIKLRFPKNANHGDIIHFMGMDTVNQLEPYFHLELSTFDDKTSIFSPGTKTQIVYRSLSGFFAFDSVKSTWILYDSDTTDRLRTVSGNTNLFPNETVSVVGTNNTDPSVINLTLPKNVDAGVKITVALNYMRKGQTVNIVTQTPDMILTNNVLMQFPKRSNYPPSGNWVNTNKLTFNGTTDYPPIITFAYIPMGPTMGQWMVVENSPIVERTDPLNPARLGVIALATQVQANLDKAQIAANPLAKEIAITPETLANRTALETRQGIAAISTKAQNQLTTDNAAYDDITIVTPLKLNQKQATEEMRGLAEIATQTEANSITDDERIITAKKLNGRRASEAMAGVAQLVQKSGVEATSRNAAGTGVFNYADHVRIVTPLVLREFKASETQQGGGFLALDSEVIAGTPNPAGIPLIVTPEQLHKKTATEGRIGFTQTATQIESNAGADDFKYITPKKLAGRASTEAMTGLAKIATQAEFDAGATNVMISTPLKIKTFFNRPARTSVNADSGLTESGTLWTTYGLDIQAASELQRGTLKLSTQALTDAGADDTTAVTPKKLQAKKSTTSAEGIIRVANTAETSAGLSPNTAVCPLNLKNIIQTDVKWEASPTLRGPVKLADGALVWVGTDVAGSTKPLADYFKTGYAISPYELNNTLQHYLPISAKAVDSDKLDNLDSSQFIRRDIDQTVAGTLSLAKNILVEGTSTFTGVITLGKRLDTAWETDSVRIQLNTPQVSAFWRHTLHDTQTGSSTGTSQSRYSIGYISGKIVTFKSGNDGTQFHTNVDFDSTVNVKSNIKTDRHMYVGSTGSYWIGEKQIVTIGSDPSNILFGNTTDSTYIRTKDANTLMAQDTTSIYRVLTQKNMKSLLDPIYVNKTGDSISGRLDITAPITVTIPQTDAAVKLIGSANTKNFGSWISEITTKSLYDLLPGYVVGVPETNHETGELTGFIDHYDEFNGPGTLSQFGSSASNGSGTYQIWAPRPATAIDGHIAGTFYMRSWNTVKNDFDGWGRVYTSNNPPTASDIGAMANNGSVFDSLRIRDWIQVGNVRIYADKASKSVKFDWID